jgi:hypothetical protein
MCGMGPAFVQCAVEVELWLWLVKYSGQAQHQAEHSVCCRGRSVLSGCVSASMLVEESATVSGCISYKGSYLVTRYRATQWPSAVLKPAAQLLHAP